MRATSRETGSRKLFSANTIADGSNKTNTLGKSYLSQFGPLLENCAFLVDVSASGAQTGTMSSCKMEGDASDKNIAAMLQGAEADGPYHRQEWEGTQQTTLIFPGGMNVLHLLSFCSQGPSDHPDLPKRLMDQAIDSLSLNPYGSVSLNPDSVISARHFVT